jgi:two-component system NtrC family sensor kinase
MRVSAKADGIPIVVMTGLNDRTLAMKAVQGGAQDYLVKGTVDSNLLVHSLRYAIERKKAELMLKELQEQLAHASKMAAVGTLTGGVAHRIKDPLTVIVTNIHMMKDLIEKKKEFIDAGELRKMVEKIDSASDFAQKTVSDLFLFTRECRLEMKPLDAVKLIEESIFSLKETDLEKIKITRNFDRDLPAVSGSREKLVLAFSNIIQNAAEAMPKGGTLGIRAAKTKDGGWVEISFLDSGCGIPEKKLQSIFEPFFTTKELGTGLGLAMTHEIIARHKGAISVKSRSMRKASEDTDWYKTEDPERGTTVTVRLPVTSDK